MSENTFQVAERDGILLVKVGNLLSEYANKEVLDAVESYLEAGQNQCIIDMSSVAFINSIGLNLLIILHKQMKERDGRFIIANASDKIRQLFTITKLDPIFAQSDSIEAAIAEMKG